MTLSSVGPWSPLHHKITAPGLPAATVSRPRLSSLFASLLAEHEAVAVFATAGSGKTVQTQLFARECDWPLAWLTLDESDRSPSRLLTYLAAALAPYSPSAPAVLDEAFVRTSVPEEAAAVLAESIEAAKLLVVFDHCEAVAGDERCCSVLRTFIDYLPASARTVLLSRCEIEGFAGRMLLQGRMARILDHDLALTLEEAHLFAETHGESAEDIESRWLDAGGWMAAFAFGCEGGTSRADRVRDFRSYIAVEVLGSLPDDERQFLLDTSVLPSVSLQSAVELCGPGGRSMWHRLATRHLPATISTAGVIVYHPCLRDHLRERLESEDPARMQRLYLRAGNFMLAHRQYEDAVELFLRLALFDRALEAAQGACLSLTARGDWPTFLRWADALGWDRVVADPLLCAQLVKALRGARRLEEARALTRSLEDSGQLQDVVTADPSSLAHMAWSLQWRPAESLELLDRYKHNDQTAGVRYMLEVVSGDGPVEPPAGIRWSDCDRLVSWALMVQGRLDDLVAMLPSGADWPPRNPFSTPHPLFGLIWRGEILRARELFDQVPRAAKGPNRIDMWLYLESWLLLAEGDPEAAVHTAEAAVSHSRDTEFGFEPVFEIMQSWALIKSGRPAEAVPLLEDALACARRCGTVAYMDWARAGLGMAHLALGDPEAAVADLRSAVQAMLRSERYLMLPTAAVFLSEAEWMIGRARASDEAAAIAMAATKRMDAVPALQVALSNFPDVYRRQLERSDDPEWRNVRATPMVVTAQEPSGFEGQVTPVDLQVFGDRPRIVVGDVVTQVRRLKVIELVAYLAAHPRGVPRDELQRQLFPASDRRKGSNHFRQVVHQLRRLTGISLERRSENLIVFADGFAVDSTDHRLERMLDEARHLSGRERFEQLRDALGMAVGSYLSASELEWVSDRRYRLGLRIEEAQLESAQLAFEFDEIDAARTHIEAILAQNPYSDEAYTLLIEVELAGGSEAAARAVYRRAVDNLQEIGLTPGGGMARLLVRA